MRLIKEKYVYFIYEALFSFLLVALMIWYITNYLLNFLIFLFPAIMGMWFFCRRIIKGLLLIIDIIEGPKEIQTRFLGYLYSEHLDVFYKIQYHIVYLDDTSLTKDFYIFDDAFSEELHQDDEIDVVYFRRSRIIKYISKKII